VSINTTHKAPYYWMLY